MLPVLAQPLCVWGNFGPDLSIDCQCLCPLPTSSHPSSRLILFFTSALAGHPKILFITYSVIVFAPMIPNLVMAVYYVVKRMARTCLLLFCRASSSQRKDAHRLLSDWQEHPGAHHVPSAVL